MTTELVIRSMSLDIKTNPWTPELQVDYWQAGNFPLQIVCRNPIGRRMDRELWNSFELMSLQSVPFLNSLSTPCPSKMSYLAQKMSYLHV